MEQLYAESSVKQKTTGKVIFLKTVLIIGVILLFAIGFLSGITLLTLLSIAAIIGLIWYWPRFKVEIGRASCRERV